jgi:hypothetical protein
MHGGVAEFMNGDAGGWYIAGRTAVAALIGGTAAELAGGKFSNGAWTSALQHLFNQEAHKQASGSGMDKKEGWFTRATRYMGRILSIHEPLNKDLASTGLGYITLDGEFIYTGPQTITISSAGSLVQGLGLNAEGGFFISRGGVHDNFLFKFGSFESGSIQGGVNSSADFIRFGISNTSDISGKFIDVNINTPVIGGGATLDSNFIPVGVSIGIGPGGLGASGGAGYTITQDWFKY